MPPVYRTVPLSSSDGDDERHFELSLMGAFDLVNGGIPVVFAGSSKRLLAFVALQERPTSRTAVASALWPDASEARAHANLRSAIWRLEQLAREAMKINVLELDLAVSVDVDYRDAQALAHRLLLVDIEPSDIDMASEAIKALSSDLLPDWYDDWAVIEAEDWRQLRLHALEALGEKLMTSGRFSDAIDAARAARKADPLRESSKAMLIRIHLAEGNQSEALRAFAAYRAMIKRELGVEPTPQLHALVSDLQHPDL